MQLRPAAEAWTHRRAGSTGTCAHLGRQDFALKVWENKAAISTLAFKRTEFCERGARERSITRFKPTEKVDLAKFLTGNETKSRLKRQFPAAPGRSEESS